MSSRVRGILMLVVGIALGLAASIGAGVLNERRGASPAPASTVAPEQLALLGDVMERVRSEYVDQVDDRQLVESAIRGMVEELDQHSRFLDSTEYEHIRIATSGLYTGVGLDLRLRDGSIVVVAPLAGAPAERAGILPGDVVISVDDVAVDASNVDDAIDRMRGEPGTPVTLGMHRDGELEMLEFVLERAEIEVQTVHTRYLGEGYAYVRLSGFADDTAADLGRAAEMLRDAAGSELTGLVLDLRDNPGGVLETAIEVADLFLAEGLIVSGNGRSPHASFAEYAHPGAALEEVPLVVLINAGSASASEIVAGALKDHERGRLVGERTYGKGSVQSVLPLGGGSALKLTTARYSTPSGHAINGSGVEPDFVVASVEHDTLDVTAGGGTAFAADEQLEHALKLIGYDPIKLSQAP